MDNNKATVLQYIDVFCIHSQYNRNVVFALICIMHCLPFSRIIIFTGIYIVQCMPFFQMNRATISQYNIQSFIKHIECHFSGWQLSHIFVSTTPILEARRLCPVPLLRHDAVARISANWSAAFFESCAAIGWRDCDNARLLQQDRTQGRTKTQDSHS